MNLYVPDKEGLSALDLVMKDRPAHVVFKNTGRLLYKLIIKFTDMFKYVNKLFYKIFAILKWSAADVFDYADFCACL